MYLWDPLFQWDRCYQQNHQTSFVKYIVYIPEKVFKKKDKVCLVWCFLKGNRMKTAAYERRKKSARRIQLVHIWMTTVTSTNLTHMVLLLLTDSDDLFGIFKFFLFNYCYCFRLFVESMCFYTISCISPYDKVVVSTLAIQF